MRIWVTGASGFLGGRLAQQLVALGHDVVGLSRRPALTATESCVVDLSAAAACDRLVKLASLSGAPEVIVHAASQQPGDFKIADYLRGGVLSTATVLDALPELTPRLLIYISTLSVYGVPDRNPVREIDPVNGRTPYAVSKLWSEQLTEFLAARTPVVVLRLPSLYGVGQGDSFVDGLAQVAIRNQPIELFSNGQVIRDALPVGDAVKAIVACIDRPSWVGFTVINIGCGGPQTSVEYARAVVSALASTSEIVPVDRIASQPNVYADITEARRLIAFEPTPLIESMREYARALRA